MPFSFRKSKKILPGTRLNLSKNGVSTSFGIGGVRFNTRKSKLGCITSPVFFLCSCVMLILVVQNLIK